MLFRFKVINSDGSARPWLARNAAIAFIPVLCIVVVGHDLFWTWEARSRAIEESRRAAENLVWSASQHAEDAFRLASMSLIGLVERVEIDGTGPAQLERLRHLMALQLAGTPILQGLTVIDETGASLVDGRPVTVQINVADRAFFQYHRDHPDHESYVGLVVRSRISGKWVVPVSRRIDHADGSFGGIVTATVDVGYFQSFYATFNLGHDGAAALLRDDGMLLVRHPFLESAIATSRQDTPLFRDLLPKAASGTLESVSSLDGVLRIFSYRRVAGYPLVVATALGKDEQLADWRADAAEHLLAAIVVALLLGFLGLGLAAKVGLITEAERANALADAAAAANVSLTRLSRHLARARDRAEQASRAKSRFLAGMSHELRTPLNGILGYARLLRMEGGLNPAQDERLNSMLEAGKHLLEMITCVLDMSEIEAGHLELRQVSFDVQAIATACLDLIRPSVETKQVILSMTVAPGTPRVLFADPTRLRQVLLNLLGNAAKFTNRGAIELRLRPTAHGSALRIEVTDTGPGIPADQRQRLFQDFERLDTELTSKIEGSGLGLALSRRLVAAMRGRLEHDDNPSGGSVFWLELPLNIAESHIAIEAASGERSIETTLTPALPLNVLVADDITMNRDIASSFLIAAGHRATCVEGGAEAVIAAANADFDAVLMDVRMPEMDGLEATRRIRALPGARGRVPIVALTAQVFTEQVADCRKAGMDSYLPKPFDPDSLLAALMLAITAGSERGKGIALKSTPLAEIGTSSENAIDAELAPIEKLAVLDTTAFERTSSYLAPEMVASYLQTITGLGEALLCRLHEVDALTHTPNELSEAAHTLAGSAGMFGFDRLAAMGRRFERAVQSGAAEASDLIDDLSAALEATLQTIRDR